MVENKTIEFDLETLGRFTEEVILPGVEKIVERKTKETENKLISEMDKRIALSEDKLIAEMEKRDNLIVEELKQIKNEIFSSEDKVVGKLDRVLKEQIAITYNYKILEKRITKLEAVVKILARKLNLSAEELGLVK